MKRFQFHLQAVLDQRADALQKAQLAIAAEEQKRAQLVHAMETIEQAVVDARQVFTDSLTEGLDDAADSQRLSDYIGKQRQRQHLLNLQLAEQDKAMAPLREALKQAMIRLKAIEHLKEKAWQRFLAEINKAEEETLSEIALNQYRRSLLTQ